MTDARAIIEGVLDRTEVDSLVTKAHVEQLTNELVAALQAPRDDFPHGHPELDPPEDFRARLTHIVSEIELGMECRLTFWQEGTVGETSRRWYFQIACERRDIVTGLMGVGYGGKGYLSEHATDSELIQTAFGLYKAYWEHEARENFKWRGRRVFGPHISTEALWEVAKRIDVRKPIPAPVNHDELDALDATIATMDADERDGMGPSS